MRECIRSNNCFNFPLGWIKYIVIVTYSSSFCQPCGPMSAIQCKHTGTVDKNNDLQPRLITATELVFLAQVCNGDLFTLAITLLSISSSLCAWRKYAFYEQAETEMVSNRTKLPMDIQNLWIIVGNNTAFSHLQWSNWSSFPARMTYFSFFLSTLLGMLLSLHL